MINHKLRGVSVKKNFLDNIKKKPLIIMYYVPSNKLLKYNNIFLKIHIANYTFSRDITSCEKNN